MRRSLGLAAGALALAAAVFSGMMLAELPKSEADTMVEFDVNETLAAAPSSVPVQDTGVVACAYVLTDGHRCH